MKKYRPYNYILLLAVLTMAAVSCKSEFDRVLPVKEYSDSTLTVSKARKVLYLIVNGARGWSVRDAQGANMSRLIKNATYSWNSLSDSLSNDGNGWADLMTGVTKAKHKVVDNTFSGARIDLYPSVITRVKSLRPQYRSAAFSSSSTFSEKLTTGADLSQSFSTDEEVKKAIVSELGNNASTLIIGQFSAVNNAGISSGFDNSFPAYKDAILKFDQQLGEILAALESRKNYANEDWLVVVTSNRGGDAVIPAQQDDKTIFSYPKTNTFTIIYNQAYKPYLIDKPFTGNRYTGSFLRFYSTANTDNNSVFARVRNNNNVYNLNDTASVSIEFKVKKNLRANTYTYNWPLVLSKKDTSLTARTGRGWSIAMEGNTWRFRLDRFVNGVNTNWGINGGDLLDGNWHNCSVVVLNRDFTRVAQLYQDGKFVREGVIAAGIGNIDNTAPLRLGYIRTDNQHMFDGYLSDIRIWRAALPAAVIAQYSCDSRITQGHPYWNRLVGYWPGNDGTGALIKDFSPAQNDFFITAGASTTIQWRDLNDIICPPPTSNLSVLVPKTFDLTSQIISWLAIPAPEDWMLDGKVWLNP